MVIESVAYSEGDTLAFGDERDCRRTRVETCVHAGAVRGASKVVVTPSVRHLDSSSVIEPSQIS